MAAKLTKTEAGRYTMTAPDGSPWVVKKRNPDLGGWAWMGWPEGSAFDDPRTVFRDSRADVVAAIERATPTAA